MTRSTQTGQSPTTFPRASAHHIRRGVRPSRGRIASPRTTFLTLLSLLLPVCVWTQTAMPAHNGRAQAGVDIADNEVFELVLDVDQRRVSVTIARGEDAKLKAAEFCAATFGDADYQACQFRVAARLEELQKQGTTPAPSAAADAATGISAGPAMTSERDDDDCVAEGGEAAASCANDGAAAAAPLNIIQTWRHAPIPPEMRALNATVARISPHARFMFFSDQDIVEFVRSRFPEYLKYFSGMRHKIMQIDLFRYLAVYELGGLYLDLDIAVDHPFDEAADLSKAIFPVEQKCSGAGLDDCHGLVRKYVLPLLPGEADASIYIGQYAFYAPRGHPFLKRIIDDCIHQLKTFGDDKSDAEDEMHVHEMTGNALVTRAYASFDQTDSVQLIVPTPFVAYQFGKYGRHLAFGSWKYGGPEHVQSPLRA